MNYPSRADETLGHIGWNQNPPSLSADLTTAQDLNGVANAREQRDHTSHLGHLEDMIWAVEQPSDARGGEQSGRIRVDTDGKRAVRIQSSPTIKYPFFHWLGGRGLEILRKFASFIGPGFMIAVA